MDNFQNSTLFLELGDTYIQNTFDLVFQIVSIENVMRSSLADFSTLSQIIVTGICSVLLFIGSYFRYILYEQCFDQYKSKESKPITLLILFVTISQHLTIVFNYLWGLTVILNDKWFGHDDGNGFCVFVKNLYRFDIAYAIIGGFGISFYRILYIRFDHWVKYGVGEKRLLYSILLGGLTLAVVCVVLFAQNDYEESTNGMCRLSLKSMMLELLDEYEQSRGNTSIYNYWLNVRVVLGFIGILITVIEISIYICFFHHIYKHDNSERIRRLLDQATIKRRNKKNAVTFFGQFCSFVIEISVMIFISLGTQMPQGHFIFWVKYIGFASMAIIEVLTSAQLRSKFFERWSFVRGFISHQD